MHIGRDIVNKAELIEALAARLGDKKQATAALDAVLAEIQLAVTQGERVAVTGFGVFERRIRAARTARNPRTGEPVKIKKTAVPAFRAGLAFREMVAAGKLPKPAKKTAAKKAAPTTTRAKAAPAAKIATARATRRRTPRPRPLPRRPRRPRPLRPLRPLRL